MLSTIVPPLVAIERTAVLPVLPAKAILLLSVRVPVPMTISAGPVVFDPPVRVFPPVPVVTLQPPGLISIPDGPLEVVVVPAIAIVPAPETVKVPVWVELA